MKSKQKKDVKIGLFLPCYVNCFYPEIGIKTYKFLKEMGYKVDFPLEQTCCGQPLANAGYNDDNAELYQKFFKEFKSYDYIVIPSASCTYHLKKYFFLTDDQNKNAFLEKIYELTDFLVKVHGLNKLPIKNISPTKIGIHQGCHSLRGLQQANSSENIHSKKFSNLIFLLERTKGAKLFLPERQDECCGFGGFFSVDEAAVSYAMGNRKIIEHQKNVVEIICSNDVSCLMHLAGIIKRKKLPLITKHIIEVIA